MTAGFNLTVRVWEYSDRADSVGGNVPSGTVLYENVSMRMQNPRNSLELNIQGYETSKFFSALISERPGMELVEKKHYIEIVLPTNHRYCGKMFRIIGILESDFHPSDPRKFFRVNLERSDPPHAEDYQ